MSEIDEKTGLEKEWIKQLRAIDVSILAAKYQFAGSIPPRTNAIDFVMQQEKCGYVDAVKTLNSRFSDLADVGMQSVNRTIENEKFTNQHKAIAREIVQQLDAVGAKHYRLVAQVETENGKNKSVNLGRERGSDEEKFFTKKDIIAMIPKLLYKNNAENASIIATPIDTGAYYICLDDAEVNMKQITEAGYKPCVSQKTSWNSRYVIFKMTKNDDEIRTDFNVKNGKDADSRRDINDYFSALNFLNGDKKINGLRHAFRLAGFRNKKEKHGVSIYDEETKRKLNINISSAEAEQRGSMLYPFVTLEHTENTFCKKTAEMARSGKVEDIRKGTVENVEDVVFAKAAFREATKDDKRQAKLESEIKTETDATKKKMMQNEVYELTEIKKRRESLDSLKVKTRAELLSEVRSEKVIKIADIEITPELKANRLKMQEIQRQRRANLAAKSTSSAMKL
ncbi:DNA-primase RepB domain-containing protein [Zymomonas mobilis]|uniref:DNA-primase RepB domain-containing protein n=1 Tax=Zymomonas mobilis TaxID=542 RepID=UPI0039EB7CA5